MAHMERVKAERAAKRAAARAARPVADQVRSPPAAASEPGHCGWCGKPLLNRSPAARYCDDSCRHRAFDARRKRA
jgi:hypothetical protein